MKIAPAIESLEGRQLLAITVRPPVSNPVPPASTPTTTALQPAYAAQIGLTDKLNATPTFVDEFDGTALDTSKWQIREATRHRLSPTTDEFAWTTRDAIKVGNGELQLIAHNDPVTGQFESGWIQTSTNGPLSANDDPKLVDGSTANFTQAYGYWESRIKFSSVTGMWNAFWVHSYNMPEVADDPSKANRPDIYGTEMDVVENAAVVWGSPSSNQTHHTIHGNGYASQHISASSHNTLSDPFGYHVYGLLWEPTKVTMYIDGYQVMQETNPNLVSKVAQMAILSNEIGAPGGSGALGAGRNTWGDVPVGGYGSVDTSQARMTVDYVRVWSLTGTIPTTTVTTIDTKSVRPVGLGGGGRNTIGTGVTTTLDPTTLGGGTTIGTGITLTGLSSETRTKGLV